MSYRRIVVDGLLPPSQVDAGPAPQLDWLPVSSLIIDDTYQRELKKANRNAIRRIAHAFSWARFSPVFVSPVEGGLFAIIDGQHRTHAAALCGFDSVPCQIVPMTREQQAGAFAAVNGTVTGMSVWQVYRAALAAGEQWAIQARDCAEAAGCRLMTANSSSNNKKPGEIFAISRFREIVDRFGPAHVTAALRCLLSTGEWRTAAALWENTVLFPVLGALCQRPHVSANDADTLELLDIWTIADRVTDENRARARSGAPPLGKRETMETYVLDWLDQKLPRKIAIGRAAG